MRSIVRVLTYPVVYIYFIAPLFFLGLFAVMLGRFSFRSVEYSAADLIISLLMPRTYPTMFVFLWTILTAVLLTHDFDSAVVIRYRSRRMLWMAQVQKILLLCIVYAAVLTAALAAVGLIVCDIPVNFASKDSAFFLAVGVVLPENPSFALILAVFFLTLLLAMVAMCLLVQLSKWILNNPIFGVMVMAAITLSGWIPHTERFVYPVYPFRTPVYGKWLNTPSIFLDLLIPLGWVAGLIAIGLIVSQRRDFLNVHQK